MSDNYEWLKEQFGLDKTAGNNESVAEYQEKLAANILFQRAAVEYLEKEAAAAGADLSQLSDGDVLQLAQERYVNYLENGGQEKTASAPVALSEEQEFFELHKFAGEIQGMAAYTTFQNLMKEAGRGGEILDKAKDVVGKVRASGRAAGKSIDDLVERAGSVSLARANEIQEQELMRARGRLGMNYTEPKAQQLAKEHADLQLREEARKSGAKRLAVGGAAGIGVAGAGGTAAAMSGKDKEASATEQLVQLRMYDMLKEAGYVDREGNVFEPDGGQRKEAAGFMDAVDQEALVRLQRAGYR